MRTALVHDWFQGYHGAERTVAAMLDLFARDPGHLHLPRRPRAAAAAAGLGDRARVAPGRAARGAPARPRPGALALAVALHAALLRAPRPLRLRARAQLLARLRGRASGRRRTRCTSATATRPMRYVWMPAAEQNRVNGVQGRAPCGRCAGRLRRWDREASRRPDVYVANSTAVAERITQLLRARRRGGPAAGGGRRLPA